MLRSTGVRFSVRLEADVPQVQVPQYEQQIPQVVPSLCHGQRSSPLWSAGGAAPHWAGEKRQLYHRTFSGPAGGRYREDDGRETGDDEEQICPSSPQCLFLEHLQLSARSTAVIYSRRCCWGSFLPSDPAITPPNETRLQPPRTNT